MDFCFVQIFFSDNTRVRIFIFLSRKVHIFFPVLNIRLYDKNSESYYFFPLQNQNIFFQQHWESECFFRKKTYPPPLQVKWSFPKWFKNSFPANSIFSIDMPKLSSAYPVLIDLIAVDISSIDTVRGGITSRISLMD